MTPEAILFALRVLSGALLMLFMGALFIMLWRDYRGMALEVESRRRQRGRLVVVKAEGIGIKPGTTYPLLPLTSVGRAPTNTITLNDTFASNEHALFSLRGGQWWIEDRGSSNGTLLNGYLVEEPTVISAGDVIGVGRIEMKLELE